MVNWAGRSDQICVLRHADPIGFQISRDKSLNKKSLSKKLIALSFLRRISPRENWSLVTMTQLAWDDKATPLWFAEYERIEAESIIDQSSHQCHRIEPVRDFVNDASFGALNAILRRQVAAIPSPYAMIQHSGFLSPISSKSFSLECVQLPEVATDVLNCIRLHG